MDNREKLRDLLCDTFLLTPEAFRFDLRRDEVETWDSLGVVALAVGVQDVFGHHFTPEEATAVRSVPDLIARLEARGLQF